MKRKGPLRFLEKKKKKKRKPTNGEKNAMLEKERGSCQRYKNYMKMCILVH
jgi:hypothetical protein